MHDYVCFRIKSCTWEFLWKSLSFMGLHAWVAKITRLSPCRDLSQFSVSRVDFLRWLYVSRVDPLLSWVSFGKSDFQEKHFKVSFMQSLLFNWFLKFCQCLFLLIQCDKFTKLVTYIQHCMDLQLAVDPYKKHVLFESMDWLPKIHIVSWHISANQISTKHSPTAVVWCEEWGLQFLQKSDIWEKNWSPFCLFWTSKIRHFDS